MIEEQQAIQMLLQYKETTGKTQTEIAKELDISNPQLSQFLGGTYKAPHIIIPKIEQFFELKAQKDIAPKAPDYKKTSISNKVYKLIEYCHIQGKIAVAYGDAGVGKTMAVKQYQKNHPDSAMVITVSPCFASITGVNELIAEQLRIKEKVARKIYGEAIAKLKGNIPLTSQDVKALEEILWSEVGTKEDYEAECGQKPLGEFVREIVGVEMTAAKAAFAEFLDETNLDSRQIYFVNQIVEFPHEEEYREHSFDLQPVKGVQKVVYLYESEKTKGKEKRQQIQLQKGLHIGKDPGR